MKNFFAKFYAMAILVTLSTLFLFANIPAFSEDMEEKITNCASEVADSFGDSAEAIQKKLGKPLKMDTKKQKNAPDPQITDTYVTLEYDNIAFSIFVSGYPSADSRVIAMYCSSPQYKLAHFSVGDSLDKVRKYLGAPGHKEPGAVLYDGGYGSLTFWYGADNKITAIRASVHMD